MKLIQKCGKTPCWNVPSVLFINPVQGEGAGAVSGLEELTSAACDCAHSGCQGRGSFLQGCAPGTKSTRTNTLLYLDLHSLLRIPENLSPFLQPEPSPWVATFESILPFYAISI